jgi:uncharacterized protein
MRRFLLPLLLAVSQPAIAQEVDFFTLASGEVGGNYFAVARAICSEMNRSAKGKMRCSPEATPGSVYNLDGLASGQIDFAIVQSDWLLSAQAGSGVFKSNGPMPDLVGVYALYQEQVTILVGEDSTIKSMKDFFGATVDLGPPSSGRRATSERVMFALKMTPLNLGQVSELSNGAAIDELCSGRIDAVMLVTGHPDQSVARAIHDCGARIVSFSADDQNKLNGENGLYARSVIPEGTYGVGTAEVQTVAVTATLVTRQKAGGTHSASANALASAIRDASVRLGRRVPVLSDLYVSISWPANMPIPLYPGIVTSP